MSEAAVRKMTLPEFLTWQLDQRDRYELVDGQPVAMTGARIRHDRVTGNALTEIRRQFRGNGNPCDAFTADIGIITPHGNLRRPDVSVLCPPLDEEAMTSDSPRLVVEVLSESTEYIDRLVKLDEYKALESLEYIVIADPTRVAVAFWFRAADRAWRHTTFKQMDQTIEMPILGLSVTIPSLYDRVTIEPRPRPRLVWDDPV